MCVEREGQDLRYKGTLKDQNLMIFNNVINFISFGTMKLNDKIPLSTSIDF